MVLKKRRISYKWRFFAPMLLTIWGLVIGIAVWQLNHERELQTKFVQGQLDFVKERTVAAAASPQQELLKPFLEFARNYYLANPNFSNIRISIFDREGEIVDSVGSPIRLTNEERQQSSSGVIERKSTIQELKSRTFMYASGDTKDGAYMVDVALPIDQRLEKYLQGDRQKMWLIVAGVLVIVTLSLWLSSRYLTSNIKLLREFANRSANDTGFIPGTDFPHDELGDIARQIVSIYNERAKVRRRLDYEHQVAMNAIKEKALQKRQLTNNINHELKTPIGVIKGYLDTLCDTEDLDPEIRDHFIRKARDHANRLVELVADVSAITRLEDGMNLINTEIIDYHDVVFSFAADISESGALGRMEFTYDIPIGTTVRGNTNLLNAMLMNLAKNAANYSNGTMCRLEYNGVVNDGADYSFSFYDDGTGVPDEALPHLFERFYRIDSGRARKSGGTGLGLAIVSNTIQAHGGSIKGVNRPGFGLELQFTLPRAAKTRERQKAPSKS